MALTGTHGAGDPGATSDDNLRDLAIINMVPRWAPTTAYTTNQQVISPNNDVVSAVSAHTSGASYTPGNWQGGTPSGTITMFGGAVAPWGYLICNGASVLRATYPALFTAIGVAFGSVDGTHFTLPNLLGSMPTGATPGAVGGAATHTLTTAEMPSHNHTQDAHGHSISTYASGASSDGTLVSSNQDAGAGALGGTSTTQAATATNQTTGGGAAFSIIPPYVGVNFIIRT